MRLSEAKNLPPEMVSVLVIREEIKGVKFAIRFEQSDLALTSGGERAIQIKCELEDSDVIDFFEKEAAEVLDRYGVDALELDCIQVKDNKDYLFPGPVIIMEGAKAEKDGKEFYLALETLPTLSGFFGTVMIPQFNPPLALTQALMTGGYTRTLLKRIREFPSAYGISSYRPRYYACLGRIASQEERDLKWHI